MQHQLFEDPKPEVEVPPELLSFCRQLVNAYQAGQFGGTVHEVHPSLPLGSRANFLYFTLAPAINFQRKSEGLWLAAMKTYADPETRFVFFPEETERGRDAYFTALRKYALAAFPEKHTSIWFTLSETLRDNYDSDPRRLLEVSGNDVVRIKEVIAASKSRFPYLSGPKLLNYWLYMLTCFTDVRLERTSEISIIPDTHVIQASVRLGVVDPETSDRDDVAAAWYQILEGSGMAPIDLHAPLWRWSRLGFPEIEVERSEALAHV
jgi:hypothetical protein